MNIEICLSPALFPFYNTNKQATVVVIDIFRATTCMCTAFTTGVNSILPIAAISEAEKLKSQGLLVGAERNVAKCSFADFGNSPFEYMDEKLAGQDIAMTTTNGTQAINLAKGNDKILIGAFSNFDALANYFRQRKQDIILLCAGWNNHINTEDTLFAGAFAEKLLSSAPYKYTSDAVRIALALWKQVKNDIPAFLSGSEHIQRLLEHGLENDIRFCLLRNSSEAIPYYDHQTQTIRNYSSY